MFTNGLSMPLFLRALDEKPEHGVETHRLSRKEKVPDTLVRKEGHASNSASCCKLLRYNSTYLSNDTRIKKIKLQELDKELKVR